MSDREAIYYRELGERAIACKYWSWYAGMRVLRGESCLGRIAESSGAPLALRTVYARPYEPIINEVQPGDIPDLRDSPTMGALLALVREVFCDPGISVQLIDDDTWEVDGVDAAGDSEAWALIDALEIAGVSRGRNAN
jgi:hypothetical protein